MSDLQYDVVVNLVSKGDLTLPAGATNRIGDSGTKLGAKWADSFGRGVSGAGSMLSRIGDTMTSAGMAAVSAAATAGMALGTAAATGLGFATKAAFDFNEQIENSTIAIGAIANANGLSNGIEDGMEKAGSVISKMRADAASLPGEFKDLERIMTDIASAGAQNGLNLSDMEKMAAKTMTAGAVLGVRSDVAGREMAMMLEGHARATEPLFRSMGLGDARSFNHLSSKDRLAKINGSLDALEPATSKYQNSWQGIKTTAVDALRQFAGTAGKPLFDTAKTMLKGFNLRSMSGQFDVIASMIGYKLNDAFVYAVDGIKHWYPAVKTFAVSLQDHLRAAFVELEPLFHRIGAGLEKFLKDPEAVDKLAHAAKLYAGVAIGAKVGGLALSAAPTLAKAAMAAPEIAVPAAATAALALAGLAYVTYGVTHALEDTNSKFHDFDVARLNSIQTELGKLEVSMSSVTDTLISKVLNPLSETFGAGVLGSIQVGLQGLNLALEMISMPTNAAVALWKKYHPEVTEDAPLPIDRSMDIMSLHALGGDGYGGNGRKPETPKTNVHIANVEIKVNSNQDPNRIAKRTANILMDYAKNPRSSGMSGNPALSR